MPDLHTMRSTPSIAACRMLQVLPPATRYLLRGGAAVRAAAEASLDLAIPSVACRAAANGAWAALWLGPDEWLLLGPETLTAVPAALGAALAPLPHSLVDVSHRQSALSVSGPEATTLLAAGCPLDLDAAAFPIGMCTRTVLAKAQVILWRIGEQAFRIEVARSLTAYVSQFLAEAARGIT